MKNDNIQASKMITFTPWKRITYSTLENDNIQEFKNDNIYTMKKDNILYTRKWYHPGHHFRVKRMLFFFIWCYHLVLSFDVIISHSLQMLSLLCYHFSLYMIGVIIYVII
jgi:hypothetical protein